MTVSLLITLKFCYLGLIPLTQISTTAEVPADELTTCKPVPLSLGKFGSVQLISTALTTKLGGMYERMLPISPATLQVSTPNPATLCTACCSRYAVFWTASVYGHCEPDNSTVNIQHSTVDHICNHYYNKPAFLFCFQEVYTVIHFCRYKNIFVH